MRVILISLQPQDKIFFEAAAQSAALEFVHVGDAEQGCVEMQQGGDAVVIIDAATKEMYQAFETAMGEKIGLFSDLANSNHLFFIAPSDLQDSVYLVQSDICGHIIERSFIDENQAIMGNVFKQALSDKAFGLEKYFGPEARTQIIQVTKSAQKRAIVESLRTHLLKIGFKSRMAAVIATATDELIMNAIFDAPIDDVGKHVYAQTPRNAELELSGKSIVTLKIAFDGKIFAVAVTDQYGSLNKKKLISQHLGKSYKDNEYAAKALSAGAGLGLTHVFHNCSGMIVSCETGERTEVSLFFRKTDSFKSFKGQFRFLSTFAYFSG